MGYQYYTEKEGCETEIYIGDRKLPTLGKFNMCRLIDDGGFEINYKDTNGYVHRLITMETIELIKSCEQ